MTDIKEITEFDLKDCKIKDVFAIPAGVVGLYFNERTGELFTDYLLGMGLVKAPGEVNYRLRPLDYSVDPDTNDHPTCELADTRFNFLTMIQQEALDNAEEYGDWQDVAEQRIRDREEAPVSVDVAVAELQGKYDLLEGRYQKLVSDVAQHPLVEFTEKYGRYACRYCLGSGPTLTDVHHMSYCLWQECRNLQSNGFKHAF